LNTDLILVFGWGPEEEGRFSSLLHIAKTAETLGLQIGVFLFADGVVLARRGMAEKIGEAVAERFRSILESEQVKVFACEEALRGRGLSKEDLEPQVSMIGYAAFLDRAMKAKTVISL